MLIVTYDSPSADWHRPFDHRNFLWLGAGKESIIRTERKHHEASSEQHSEAPVSWLFLFKGILGNEESYQCFCISHVSL